MTGSDSLAWIDPAVLDRPESSLSILCVLPTLSPYGGVISVINAMNILSDLGHHVTLVSLSKMRNDSVFPRMEPIYVELGSSLPEEWAFSHDILLATSWETASAVAELGRMNDAVTTFYYIQDFEADFYPSDDTYHRNAVLQTYDMIPNKIVKTGHLQRRLAAEGWSAFRIPPGMDLDIFYPRAGKPSTREPGVIAMARPGTQNEHRGFDILSDVYHLLEERRPDVNLAVFGTDDLPATFPGRNLGRLQSSQLPDVYSSYPVFVDVSRVHGFGRTGVEAMACGTACVLSASGGISEYAVNGENSLIVPVGDVPATFDAIVKLIDDRNLCDLLSDKGVESVEGYSDYASAAVLEQLFSDAAADAFPGHDSPQDGTPIHADR